MNMESKGQRTNYALTALLLAFSATLHADPSPSIHLRTCGTYEAKGQLECSTVKSCSITIFENSLSATKIQLIEPSDLYLNLSGDTIAIEIDIIAITSERVQAKTRSKIPKRAHPQQSSSDLILKRAAACEK